MIIVGIDPGVLTGYARWDTGIMRLLTVQTVAIHEAMECVSVRRPDLVIFEDARQRRWFGKMDGEQFKYGAAVREGAGSIKRDCAIWQAFLEWRGIDFVAKCPQRGATKWNSDRFQATTGWTARTSEHARDAAVLVVGLFDYQARRLLEISRQQRLTKIAARAKA